MYCAGLIFSVDFGVVGLQTGNMQDPKDWHFPMVCPVCKAECGTTCRVSTAKGLLTVNIECGACLHEWPISAPAPAVFLSKNAPPVFLTTKVDRQRRPS
jgi:hypothetical protein